MNNIVENDQQSCKSTATSIADNNVIIVNGAKIKGNFTGVQVGTATDATCLMTSTMSNNITSIVTAIQQQANRANTDLFNDGNLVNDENNTFNLDQTITNNISQINQTLCDASNITQSSNNYVYVANTSVGGNFVGVASNSSSKANCSMTNMMKNVVYNRQQADVTQSNRITGMFAGILGAVVLIVGLIVIILIVLCSISAISAGGHRTHKEERKDDRTEQKQEEERIHLEQEQIANSRTFSSMLSTTPYNSPALYY